MAINFNANPYYDDYDQTKGYHRILFKPGVAVQARELTQLQTILNNQITQFGNHVFVDGSLVIPGQAALDVEYYSVKVVENTTLVASLIGEIVVGGTTGVKAEVINATAEDADGNPATLFIKYLNSGTNGSTKTFANSETITVDGGSAYVTAITPVLPETSAAYTGTAYTITPGVMYIKGNFVYFTQQTYIINKYGKANDVIIGFDVKESIKGYDDDNTLLDPAQGSYNFSAPGADRYFIGLTLAKRALTSVVADDENFIELIRVQDYKVISKKPPAEYNFLADEFARRTYDESGNYIVRPYDLKLLEEREFYKLTASGSADKIVAKVSPGKAYVKGYELDSLQTMIATVDKARDTASVNNGSVFLSIGNYVFVDNVDNIPTNLDDNIPLLNLYDSTAGSGSIIGTARLRFFKYSSGTVGTTGAVYKAFLFDIVMNAGEVFGSVQSLGYSSVFTADTVLESGSAVIKDQDKKAYIFPMPRNYIESIASNETSYTAYKVYQLTVTSGNDEITVTAPTDTVFNQAKTNENFQVINIDTGAHTDIEGLSASLIFAGQDCTITLDSAVGLDTDFMIIAKLDKSNSSSNSKAKTLNSNQAIDKLTQAACEATTISLGKADIYRLVSVKMTLAGAFGDGTYNATSEIDITDRYTLDNGQKAAYYGLGSIRLKKGQTKPTGPIRITFDYFTHGSGDYFSVESYPVDYANIPTVTFDGIEYALRDCLDFRPRINDAGTDFSAGLFPDYEDSLICDYAYYLGKISKIVLNKKGALSVIDGDSDLNPIEPATPEDAMTLYVLTQDPYVLDITNNIRIKRIPNTRYTMGDIGNLETRVKNVEYYVALNLLELDAQQYQIQDGSGTDLYKNGFVVDSFTGHGVGDVYNADYSCSVDQKKRELRPKSDAYFYNLVEVNTTDNQRTTDNYALAGDLIMLDYTEEAFATNTKFSETLTLNPYKMVTHVGIITGDSSDIWYDYESAPDVYVNDSGDYDSLLTSAAVSKKQGTFWGEWVPRVVYDDQGRVAKTWDERYEFQYNTVQETIATSTIPKMRNTTIDFSVKGLKASTRLYVFFDGINVSRDCKLNRVLGSDLAQSFKVLSDTAESIITDANGNASITFKYSANKYNLNTGKHLLRVSDSETGNMIDESTSAEMIFTSRGELRTVQDKIVSTRVGKNTANEDVRNYVIADPRNDPRDIIPTGESTEILLDNGLVEITTVIPENTYNGDGTYNNTTRTVTTVVDPIVITGNGHVVTEPISTLIDPDYPVDHTGYIETIFMAAMGRYPDPAEKADLYATAAQRGITDATITGMTFTDGVDQNGNAHNFVVNNGLGGIETVGSGGELLYPQTYNQNTLDVALFTKDFIIKYSDTALDGSSSILNNHRGVLGNDVEAAASHLAVAAVIGVATSTNFDDAVTFKDAAVVASVKL